MYAQLVVSRFSGVFKNAVLFAFRHQPGMRNSKTMVAKVFILVAFYANKKSVFCNCLPIGPYKLAFLTETIRLIKSEDDDLDHCIIKGKQIEASRRKNERKDYQLG